MSRNLTSTSDIPYPGLFHGTRGASREPLFDESRVPFNSGSSNGIRRFSIAHTMRTATHADPGLERLFQNVGKPDQIPRSWNGTFGGVYISREIGQ